MQVVSTGHGPQARPVASGFPGLGESRQADEDLARRLPGLGNYLAASFPALRRLDIVIARHGRQRRLEARFAFHSSNIERLFQAEIAPPFEARDLLMAFVELEARLRVALPVDCPDWSRIELEARLDRQRRTLAILLGRHRAALPTEVKAAYERLSATLDDLARLISSGSTAPPAAADLLRTAESLVRSLAELVDGAGFRPA